MCGICGFNWENKELAKRMIKSIRHRGPNDKGVYVDKVSLGNVRLSIIDLSKKGHMPFEYEHKGRKVVITYNGETYNFQNIKDKLKSLGYKFRSKTDTEVLAAAYIEYGPDFVTQLNGMWDFCIYDPGERKLILSRDRMGVKPLYYYYKNRKFMFASEIKAILEHTRVKREINWQIANRYMTMRYCFGEETIFKNIRKLLPGNNMIYDLKTDQIKIQRYWNNEPNQVYINDLRKERQQFLTLFKDSIKKRLISDVPLGVFLSGGMDSSAMIALLRELDKDAEIKTYTIGFEKGGHVNELQWAKKISDKFNTAHKEYYMKAKDAAILDKIMWHMDEPMADSALLPLYYLSKNAAKEVTVVLTGDGGDELFGGYDQYRIYNYAKYLSKIPFAQHISKPVIKASPHSLLSKFYKHSGDIGKHNITNRVFSMLQNAKEKDYFSLYSNLIGIMDEKERKEVFKNKFFEEIKTSEMNNYLKKPKEFLSKFSHYDQNILLSDAFLMKTDRMTMAHSLEARVPLIDFRLVEFSNKIAPGHKINFDRTKYLLRKSFEKKLPYDLVWRKKQTFHVPKENWLRDELKEYVDSRLSEKKIEKTGIMNKTAVAKVLSRYRSGKLYYGRQVWNLLCFQEWFEKFDMVK